LPARRNLKRWLADIITQEGKTPGHIALVFCSDEYLLEINRKFLAHDFYTDIITFDHYDPERISGDLFISSERVRENAPGFGVPFLHELNRVMAHGILHLCGYGDKTPAQKKKMRSLEDMYLRQL